MSIGTEKKPDQAKYNPWTDPFQWKAAGVVAVIGVLIITGMVVWSARSIAKSERETEAYLASRAAADAARWTGSTQDDGQASSKSPSPGGGYSPGMSDADVNRLTTYAVFLGRATACGVDTSHATNAVAAWIEAKMPPGSPDRATLFPIFAQGVESHARMQASGRSPDTCDQVREQFANMAWP